MGDLKCQAQALSLMATQGSLGTFPLSVHPSSVLALLFSGVRRTDGPLGSP